jgi:hypothetical protein
MILSQKINLPQQKTTRLTANLKFLTPEHLKELSKEDVVYAPSTLKKHQWVSKIYQGLFL